MRSGTTFVLSLTALLSAACAREAPKPGAGAPEAAPVKVAVGEVVADGGRNERAMPARVEARERASLASRFPASVVELPFREGDRVAAGAVLVRLDDAAMRSALAAAEASASAAQADLTRTASLLSKGAATQREMEDAKSRAAGARAAVSAAKDSLTYAALRAPFAGRIASRPVNLGDVAAPGRPLIEIEGDGGMELRASLDSDVVSLVRPGMALKVLVDGQAQPLEARVRAVSPAGDDATHRFELRADLPAADGLRSGLFARLVVPAPETEARLMVPSAALFHRGGLVGVFVIAEGRARLRYVAVGDAKGDRTEARAGLVAGERVALDPGPLSDGAAVTTDARPAER